MSLPETVAFVTITSQSWQKGNIEGQVKAGTYEWSFSWRFLDGKLFLHPTLGRSLIYEPLSRFLERHDYQLEVGGDYEFYLRTKL